MDDVDEVAAGLWITLLIDVVVCVKEAHRSVHFGSMEGVVSLCTYVGLDCHC